jgi:hypothetical protein
VGGERPRLLVVADASDRGAHAVAEVVAARHGAQAVRRVAPATLTTTAAWEHRIVAGRPSTSLRLPDGTWLADPPAAVVLNRTRWVIPPTMSSEADQQYAVMELHALLLSWLAGLDGLVVNPPTPSNLAGVGVTDLDLLARLARRGLPIRTLELTTQRRSATAAPAAHADPPYRWSPEPSGRARVLVAGSTTVGAPSAADRLCREVAEALRCPLLEVSVVREVDRGWVVAAVDPLPALDAPAEVRAVADLIDRSAASYDPAPQVIGASSSHPAPGGRAAT